GPRRKSAGTALSFSVGRDPYRHGLTPHAVVPRKNLAPMACRVFLPRCLAREVDPPATGPSPGGIKDTAQHLFCERTSSLTPPGLPPVRLPAHRHGLAPAQSAGESPLVERLAPSVDRVRKSGKCRSVLG